MNKKSLPLILVVDGTGTQGGNVARALLQRGYRVRILSRNPSSPAALLLQNQGAEIIQGDLGQPASLLPVMNNVTALFSAQYSDPADSSIEVRNTVNMVQEALKAGVQQVIHTSVIGTNIFPRWSKSTFLTTVWENKYKVEELIRHGGFNNWTILHPSFFMENFAEPLSRFMAPELKFGKLFGVLHPDTPIKLNCGEDTARFALEGFEKPALFQAKDINIAGDELSMKDIALILSEVLERNIVYEEVTKEEGIRRGLFEGTVHSHQWMNEVPGFGFDIQETKKYGLPMTSLLTWIKRNKNRINLIDG